ncbi:DUF6174 domain-containing protein [Scytonema sp. UIC 10036]|uniref:DUF6174 domain-containing protein n=1 Tax=Scytonema sp. UIC 10036 TaxID=2304196 RepID=UPI001A9B8DF5
MALTPTDAQVQLVQTVKNSNQQNANNSEELARNQKLWNTQGVLNYSYTLTKSCFCPPDARGPVVIEVSNGNTTSVTSVSTGQSVNREFFDKYDTIPKLFDAIADAIARRADSLKVKYDPAFGYPTQINIDYSYQMADEELFLTIENFASKSTNSSRANVFELSGASVEVSYSDTSVLGGPRLNYRDNNINRTFIGEEIRVQETELGQLITVTLEAIPDLRTVTFTLILPLVKPSTASERVRIQVPGITTTTQTTIAGPGPGAEKTYTTINLKGTAQFIVS